MPLSTLQLNPPTMIIFALFVMAFTRDSAAAQQQSFDPWTVEHFQLAREAQLKNDLDVAAKEYQLILTRNPKFAEVYLNLGVVYHQQKKYREAIKTLRTAVSLKPNLLGAQVFLGIDLYMIQDFKGALAPLQKALELNLKDRQAGMYLALTYIALDKPENAIEQLRQTAQYHPEDVELHYHLAEAHTEAMKQSSLHLGAAHGNSAVYHWAAAISAEQKHEMLTAAESYLKALAIDPNIAELYLNLGLALRKLGIPDLAAAAFHRYSLLHPNRDLASLKLDESMVVAPADDAVFQEHKKKFGQMWEALPPVQADPSTPRVADEFITGEIKKVLDSPGHSGLRSALTLYSEGDYKGAAEKLRHDRDTHVEHWITSYLMARSYLLAADYDAAQDVLAGRLMTFLHLPAVALLRVEINTQLALRYLTFVTSKQPDSFPARLLRAKYYAASNQPEEAIRAYQEILKLAPDRLGIHLALGNLYTDRLDWPAAIEAYQAELALNPNNALALALLGHAYAENRDADQAIEVLEGLLKIHTNDAKAYADLGNAWRIKDEATKAIEAYKQALFLDGTQHDLHYRLFQLYRKLRENKLAQIHLTKFQEGEAKKKRETKQIGPAGQSSSK